MAKIHLADGSVREVANESSWLDVAKAISNSMAKKMVVAKVDGELTDLSRPVVDGAQVEFFDGASPEGLHAIPLGWKAEKVDARLHHIMLDIHHACVEHGGEGEQTNYVQGANIAGFVKVADAMLSQGVI